MCELLILWALYDASSIYFLKWDYRTNSFPGKPFRHTTWMPAQVHSTCWQASQDIAEIAASDRVSDAVANFEQHKQSAFMRASALLPSSTPRTLPSSTRP